MDRLNRVRVAVAGEVVEISWADRDALVEQLAGEPELVALFRAVGSTRPVEIPDRLQARLADEVARWARSSGFPAGLQELRDVLEDDE
jgi:hypothetical protein